MGHGVGSGAPLVVPVADSRDTRLFIELCSYGSDLAEARHALDLAVHGKQDRSPLGDAASAYLIGFAVVAYCRTILQSSVRQPLTNHVHVPAEFEGVHEQVRMFRNATIAHSQSKLSTTYSVGVLDPVSLELSYVAGVTVNGPLPQHLVHQFRMLIEAMLDELGAVIEPVRAKLESELRQADPHELLARPRPEVLVVFPEEFNPRTRRPPYSTGHTLYLDHPADGGAAPTDPTASS